MMAVVPVTDRKAAPSPPPIPILFFLLLVALGTLAIVASGVDATNTVPPGLNQNGHWSTATLSYARTGLAITSLGTKTFFAGGIGSRGVTNIIDIYDSNTGEWSFSSLSVSRAYLSATSVGSLAMFAGGATYYSVFEDETGISVGNMTGMCYESVVDIYNNETDSWSQATLSLPRASLAAVTVSSYAIFGGGIACTGLPSTAVDIYDAQNSVWYTSNLLVAESGYFEATEVDGMIAIFGGGGYYLYPSGSASVNVNLFNVSSQRWAIATTTVARSNSAAASVIGINLALIAGGINVVSSNEDDLIVSTSSVSVYDGNTNAWSQASLSTPRYGLGGAGLVTVALFGGGMTLTNPQNDPDECPTNQYLTAIVDIYDAITSSWSTATLSQARYQTTAAGNIENGLAFFAGGVRSIFSYPVASPSPSSMMVSKRGVVVAARSNSSSYILEDGNYSNVIDIYNSLLPTPVPSVIPQAPPPVFIPPKVVTVCTGVVGSPPNFNWIGVMVVLIVASVISVILICYMAYVIYMFVAKRFTVDMAARFEGGAGGAVKITAKALSRGSPLHKPSTPYFNIIGAQIPTGARPSGPTYPRP